jgi:hypothetical protein
MDEEEVMDEAIEEHHVAHLLIGELKSMSPSDDRYDAKFKVLAESVKHHIKEEESQVFPKADPSSLETSEFHREVMERRKELLAGEKRRSGGSRKKTAGVMRRAKRRGRAA